MSVVYLPAYSFDPAPRVSELLSIYGRISIASDRLLHEYYAVKCLFLTHQRKTAIRCGDAILGNGGVKLSDGYIKGNCATAF